MGAWGAKLYQDDTAQDVKEVFTAGLREGKGTEEITENLIRQYSSAMDDIYCAPAFWFSLADTQWNLGRLMPEVKEQALTWLDKGGDLSVWQEENPKLAPQRAAVLSDLREKLNTPQPPEKKISKPRPYICPWKNGDVFAYQFKSEYSRENNCFNKYIYFVKIDDAPCYPVHTVPVVYFYKKLDDSLANISELKDVAIINQFYKPQVYEKNPEKKRKYRLTLLCTSSRMIPKDQLVYLGNTGNVKHIKDEDPEPFYVFWRYFEEYIIKNFNSWYSL